MNKTLPLLLVILTACTAVTDSQLRAVIIEAFVENGCRLNGRQLEEVTRAAGSDSEDQFRRVGEGMVRDGTIVLDTQDSAVLVNHPSCP